MSVADPIREGLARGWKVLDAATLGADRDLACDVAVVGSGAGGGVTAEILARAGLEVVLLEEGPLAGSSEFRMRERDAYPGLYQESAARQTLDKAITLLQGRCVGGGTTVGWTSSARIPPRVLAHWRSAHGLAALTDEAMAPWFERMEARTAVAPWDATPNENNNVLRRGARELGIATTPVRRNVKGCANLGYCGLGCPLNAKQSMLVTAIPAALDAGATLVHRARVTRLGMEGDRVVGCEARGVAPGGTDPGTARLRIRAKHVVLCAGAIGSPALLAASAVPDPHLVAGQRTFLHPTVVSAALMPGKVEGYFGAPQSVATDQFLAAPFDGPVGFRIETAPVHPMLAGITLPGFGAAHARWMGQLPRMQVLVALLRDGFHPQAAGGRATLRDDGWPALDYAMTPYLWEGVRRAYLAMAELQFAAGAATVMPLHESAAPYATWREARAAIAALPLRALEARILSANPMGGCAMGPDARSAVVDVQGRHHQVRNLSVHDGSVFPTGLGASPQLTIHALAARMATALAQSLGGHPVP